MVAVTKRTSKKAAPSVVCHGRLFPSDLGWFGIVWRGKQLVHVTFGHPSASAAMVQLPDGIVYDDRDLPPHIEKTIERLQKFAAGGPEDFSDIELDLSHLTDFQRRVVNACRRIKAGRCKSYGELATAAGFPGAARAVGSVMRGNRFPLIVPCHRVIAAGGNLGGYSCPAGLTMKERLLEREGAMSLKRVRNAK